jgi:hypothetical protein
MNLDLTMEKYQAYVRIMAAPHGLECECLSSFYAHLCAGDSPNRAARHSLSEWDIPNDCSVDE